QIERRLGEPGAYQDAAVAAGYRNDVAGPDDTLWTSVLRDRGANRLRPVVRGNPGRHSLARLNRRPVRPTDDRRRIGNHEGDAELAHALFGHRQADEPTPVHRHEVDGLWVDELRGNAQIRLALLAFRE